MDNVRLKHLLSVVVAIRLGGFLHTLLGVDWWCEVTHCGELGWPHVMCEWMDGAGRMAADELDGARLFGVVAHASSRSGLESSAVVMAVQRERGVGHWGSRTGG